MQLIAVVFTDWLGTLGQWSRFMSVFCCLKGGGVWMDAILFHHSPPTPPPPFDDKKFRLIWAPSPMG